MVQGCKSQKTTDVHLISPKVIFFTEYSICHLTYATPRYSISWGVVHHDVLPTTTFPTKNERKRITAVGIFFPFLLFFVLVLNKGRKRICCHHAAFRKINNVCSRLSLSLIAASVQFPTLRFFYFYLDSKQLPLFAHRSFLLISFVYNRRGAFCPTSNNFHHIYISLHSEEI